MPTSIPSNSLLSLIDFRQEFAQRFSSIGKRNFYGAKKWGMVTHKVDTLYSRGNYGKVHHVIGQGKQWHTLVRIPYMNTRFSLIIAIPYGESSIQELLQSLTPKQFQHYLKRLHIEHSSITLTIPRFRLNGDFDFGPILKLQNLTQISLTSLNSTISINNCQQFVRVGGQKLEIRSDVMSRSGDKDLDETQSDNFIPVNRPFVYFIVGKYIDLYHKPAFETIIAGYFNGPE